MDADDARYVVPHGEGCVCRVTPSRSSGARTSPETIDHQRTLIDTLREVLEASEPRLVNRLAQVLEDHAARYPATWRAAYRLKIVGEVLDELVEATDARVRVP